MGKGAAGGWCDWGLRLIVRVSAKGRKEHLVL